MRYPVILLLAALAVGCDDDGIIGVAVPGAPASIQLHSVEAAGGSVYYDTLSIDSATARYESVTCSSDVNGSPCATTNRSSGDVQNGDLDRLFSRAQSAEFQRLRDDYADHGNAVPPDGGSSKLTITVGERRRTIIWSKHVTLPAELSGFLCLLSSVRGSLALCAD